MTWPQRGDEYDDPVAVVSFTPLHRLFSSFLPVYFSCRRPGGHAQSEETLMRHAYLARVPGLPRTLDANRGADRVVSPGSRLCLQCAGLDFRDSRCRDEGRTTFGSHPRWCADEYFRGHRTSARRLASP